jgi:glyoxylase-like metal-dependent hydrolase (beta-lactamase superfamily II)
MVSLGNLSMSIHHVGAAESHADSYVLVQTSPSEADAGEDDGGGQSGTIAFIGDLAFHGTHPYMADGHSSAWLRALEHLPTALADTAVLFPGHGAPTNSAVLGDQRRYLLYYREVVRRLAAGAPGLSDTAKAELDAAMTSFLRSAPLTWMIGLGADAVAAELADERPPSANLDGDELY